LQPVSVNAIKRCKRVLDLCVVWGLPFLFSSAGLQDVQVEPHKENLEEIKASDWLNGLGKLDLNSKGCRAMSSAAGFSGKPLRAVMHKLRGEVPHCIPGKVEGLVLTDQECYALEW
jgi:hypothetical protein